MTLLRNQEQFETLLGKIPTDEPIPNFVVVYFTAKWCTACKKLNLDEIQSTVPEATWLKCDIDLNEYTAGYCGVRSIPSFLIIKDKKISGPLKNSQTEKVVEWLKTFNS